MNSTLRILTIKSLFHVHTYFPNQVELQRWLQAYIYSWSCPQHETPDLGSFFLQSSICSCSWSCEHWESTDKFRQLSPTSFSAVSSWWELPFYEPSQIGLVGIYPLVPITEQKHLTVINISLIRNECHHSTYWFPKNCFSFISFCCSLAMSLLLFCLETTKTKLIHS